MQQADFLFLPLNQAQIKGQIWAIYSKLGEGEFPWVKKFNDSGFYLIHGETVFFRYFMLL